MPSPQEQLAILRRFFAAEHGSDIALPRETMPTDIELPPPSDAEFDQQVIAGSEPARNPLRSDLRFPLDTNRLPPSSQSDADFEQQVIDSSPAARNQPRAPIARRMPRRSDIELPRVYPLDTNRLPPSSQSDADFEQQVIDSSPPSRNPRNVGPSLDPAMRRTPLDANRLPEAIPTPAGADSGRVALARLLGVAPEPQPPPDPAEAVALLNSSDMRANDPQALARNRALRQTELEDRIANEEAAAAMPPSEGFVPGEPGRRRLSRGMTPANLIADRFQLQRLRRDQATDPFTGDAETARVAGIQNALDTAAQIQRPEIGDAAETVAKRNAFAEYMKQRGLKMGEFEAASSPAGQAAAIVPFNAQASGPAQSIKDAELERAQKLRMSPQLIPGQMPIGEDGTGGAAGGFTMPPNFKPLSDTDAKSINAMRGLSHMVGDLKSTLDPTNNSVTNRGTQSIRLALYNMGVSPNISAIGGDERSQARIQLADLIKVMGASPFMAGSRNYQYMKDIYRHLTNPAATDAFLYNQLTELEKRWPQIQRAIITTHVQPDTPIDFSPTGAGDVFSTPPTADEMGPMSMDDLNTRADALMRRR